MSAAVSAMKAPTGDKGSDDISDDVIIFLFISFVEYFISFAKQVQKSSNKFVKICNKVPFIKIYHLGIFLHKFIYQNTLGH